MMIYSVKPYNQRLTTLNTHQQLAPVQRRHYRYAQEGFGEAATAKDVNFFARTLYAFAFSALVGERCRIRDVLIS